MTQWKKKECMGPQCSSEGTVMVKSRLFFREDCQLINIEKIVELENFNIVPSNIINDSGKDHQLVVILLSEALLGYMSEALLGSPVFTWFQNITPSHQWIKTKHCQKWNKLKTCISLHDEVKTI